jgi:Fe-S-cluster containining protein
MMSDKERSKLCLQCLECCKWVGVLTAVPIDIPGIKEFYEARGAKIIKDPNLPVPLIVIKSECPHLTSKGCDIYETRPQVCRDMDGSKTAFVKDFCLWNKGKIK